MSTPLSSQNPPKIFTPNAIKNLKNWRSERGQLDIIEIEIKTRAARAALFSFSDEDTLPKQWIALRPWDDRMAETIYFWSVVGLLLASGLCHIAAPRLTERWVSRIPVVRAVGGLLMVLALPCLVWRGWYFWTLFAALAVSGLWRLCFPRGSIRAQQRSYPRWVHGCLLDGGAVLMWALRP